MTSTQSLVCMYQVVAADSTNSVSVKQFHQLVNLHSEKLWCLMAPPNKVSLNQ